MKNHKVVVLNKPEWTIHYDCDARYPLCVVERFRGEIPNSSSIRRSDVGEPFRADVAVPEKHRMYWREYEDYMAFGGSPGHNAPAGFHKSCMKEYKRTFLLSNVCPQEVVFNGGRWLLLESLFREIIESYTESVVLTGSIPGKLRSFGESKINIPTHMYKYIAVKDERGDWYSAAFMMPNEPGTDDVPIFRFHVPLHNIHSMLSAASGFDIERAVQDLGIGKTKLLRHVRRLEPVMTPILKMQMRGARLNGRLVYAKSMQELDYVYSRIPSPSKYHKKYRDLAEARLNTRAKRAGQILSV